MPNQEFKDRLLEIVNDSRDPAKLEKEAEGILETVARDFGDVKAERGGTLKEDIETQLYELRFLSVGKPAPEIEAPDLEDKTMRLSEFRGKVVLLDFWGHW